MNNHFPKLEQKDNISSSPTQLKEVSLTLYRLTLK